MISDCTSSLAQQTPLEIDNKIEFVEKTHTYFYTASAGRRKRVPLSATKLLNGYFEQFDAAKIIAKNYDKWRARAGPYGDLIRSVLEKGGDRTAAEAAIRQKWAAAGEDGTLLHRFIELHLNGVPPAHVEMSRIAESVVVGEYQQFAAFESTFLLPRGLKAVRTELALVWLDENGEPTVAGQADALFADELGKHYLFDWKRVDASKRVDAGEEAFDGRTGRGVASEIPDTKFYKFSLQLGIYAAMLREQGIDVGDRRFVVRMHAGLEQAEVVQTTSRIDRVALAMLNEA
jgi:hypothetical protein